MWMLPQPDVLQQPICFFLFTGFYPSSWQEGWYCGAEGWMHTFRSHPCIQEQKTQMKNPHSALKMARCRSCINYWQPWKGLRSLTLTRPWHLSRTRLSLLFFFLYTYLFLYSPSPPPLLSLPCPHSLSPAKTKEIPTCPCPPTIKAGCWCPSHTQTGCYFCLRRFHDIF